MTKTAQKEEPTPWMDTQPMALMEAELRPSAIKGLYVCEVPYEDFINAQTLPAIADDEFAIPHTVTARELTTQQFFAELQSGSPTTTIDSAAVDSKRLVFPQQRQME